MRALHGCKICPLQFLLRFRCRVEQSSYPGFDSVYKPRVSGTVITAPGQIPATVSTPESCTTVPGISSSRCECSNRQCEWFIFDSFLALPEYVIDFEYVTRVSATCRFNFESE